MSDLISREDAINQAQDGMVVKTQDTSIHLCKTRVVTVDRINELPSAEAEWIPVIESLPKKEEYVLASVTAPDRIHDVVIIKGVDVERYSEFISAWQPLPTPYREDDDV